MTLKLTIEQARALMYLYDQVIIPEKPGNIAESLVKDIMIQVYRKLRNKLEAKKKDGYSLMLTDVEGKAYYVYFQNRDLGANWQYESYIVASQLAQLDKQYA